MGDFKNCGNEGCFLCILHKALKATGGAAAYLFYDHPPVPGLSPCVGATFHTVLGGYMDGLRSMLQYCCMVASQETRDLHGVPQWGPDVTQSGGPKQKKYD